MRDLPEPSRLRESSPVLGASGSGTALGCTVAAWAIPCLSLLLVLGSGTPARSEEAAGTLAAVRESAARVRADAERGGSTVAAEVARQAEPDPWLVLDALLADGHSGAARSLARAAPLAERTAQLELVESSNQASHAWSVRVTLDRIEALLRRGRGAEALLALEELEVPERDRLSRMRAAHARALALYAGGRGGEARPWFERAFERAKALGWLRRAQHAGRAVALLTAEAAELAQSLPIWGEVAELARRRGDEVGEAEAYQGRGFTRMRMGAFAEALVDLRRAADMHGRADNPAGEALCRSLEGNVLWQLGRDEAARAAHGRALALAKQARDDRTLAQALNNKGILHAEAGEQLTAVELYERALEIKRRLSDRLGTARTLSNLCGLRIHLGDFVGARAAGREALELYRELGSQLGAAVALGNLGAVADALGEFEQARTHYQDAYAIFERAGATTHLLDLLGNLAHVHRVEGRLDRAAALYAEATTLARASGSPVAEAEILRGRAALRFAVEEKRGALDDLRRALDLFRSAGRALDVADTLSELSEIHSELGQAEAAVDVARQALTLQRSLGDLSGTLRALEVLATRTMDGGRFREAEPLWEEARTLAERLGEPERQVDVVRRLAAFHRHRYRARAAIKEAERALALAEAHGLAHRRLHALQEVVLAHALAGDEEATVRRARELSRRLSMVARTAGEQRASGVRELGLVAWRAALLLCSQSGDVEGAFEFLELGRGQQFLESLGGRNAIRAVALPETLRAEEDAARARLALAAAARHRARRDGQRRPIRAARRAHRAAQEALRSVLERAHAERVLRAQVAYPAPVELAEVRAVLGAEEALVLYRADPKSPFALVVTRSGATLRVLRGIDEVRGLLARAPWRDPEADAGQAHARLRSTLVETLQLDEQIERVLISPEGVLHAVPFSMLFESRDVALVPSGSVLALWRSKQEAPGRGVLALGDPVYATDRAPAGASGRRLPRLEATGAEVRAVGSEVLLRQEASEGALQEALGRRKRWRAVHLACHGLVNERHPRFSALALSAEEGSDGLLTAAEVARMRFGADLVALSACETGLGRVAAAEGLFGLSRAFLFSGARQVLCSLWKVDDDATRALMVRFYDLWNPDVGEGMEASLALERAQAYVRSHEEWSHPYYWAAWTLWGADRCSPAPGHGPTAATPEADAETAPSAPPARPTEGPAAGIPRQPVLWEAAKEGSLVYLLGTIHVADERVTTLLPEVQQALERSDHFYAELDLSSAGMQALVAKMMTDSIAEPGFSVKAALGDQLYSDLQSVLHPSLKMQLPMLDNRKLWFITLLLNQSEVMKQQQDQGGGGASSLDSTLDAVVFKKAEAAGKTVGALEKPAEQIDAFAKFSDEELAVMIREGVKLIKEREAANRPSVLTELVTLYLQGDVEKIEAALVESLSPEDKEHEQLAERLKKALLYDRNKRMAERLMARVEEAGPGKTIMAGVGTVHMPGERGLVGLFEERGYRVRRIRTGAELRAPPTAEPEAPASPVGDETAIRAMLEEMRATAARIRGKAWKSEVPVAVLRRDELRAKLKVMVERELDPEQYEREVRVLRRLQMLAPDQDPLEMHMGAMKAMVQGYYDPYERKLFLIEGSQGDGYKSTLLQELIHALDDQYFDLRDRMAAIEHDSDAQFVLRCLMEGCAELARYRFETQNEDVALARLESEARREGAETEGQRRVLGEVPAFLLVDTFLHYRIGPAFVRKAVGATLEGEIDALYQNPPASAEQVLHPHKWLGENKDLPQKIRWDESLEEAPGPGWKKLTDLPWGELDLALYLDRFLGEQGGLLDLALMRKGQYVAREAHRAAAGWDGGRMITFEKEGQPLGVATAFAFDTEDDADEALAAWREALDAAYGGDLAWQVSEDGLVRFRGEFGAGRARRVGTSLLMAEGFDEPGLERVWKALEKTRFEKDPRDLFEHDGGRAPARDFEEPTAGLAIDEPAEDWDFGQPSGMVPRAVARLHASDLSAEFITLEQGLPPAGLRVVFSGVSRSMGAPPVDADAIREVTVAGHPGGVYTLSRSPAQHLELYVGSNAIRTVVVIVMGSAEGFQRRRAELEKALGTMLLRVGY